MPDNLPIRVLIVDDSPFVRKVLLRVFKSEPGFEVVGEACNGGEGIEKALSLKPDVVTLDLMMPVMDGLETLKALMEENPVPVLILSQFTHKDADLTLRALQLGAMDFVDKSTKGLMDLAGLASEITSKVRAICHRKPKRLFCEPEVLPGLCTRGVVDAVAIGASTGGPPALHAILRRFPKDISFGVLIVQHMPKGFTAPLAKRLDSICAIHVKEASAGDKVEPGVALIAPSGVHMRVRKTGDRSGEQPGMRAECMITLCNEASKNLHVPSADVLFRSVADAYGNRAMGVILTGMGSDGVEGLKAIKGIGGMTFAQDEESSVIFGMPGAAIKSGAVDKVISLTDMAETILRNA